ncbi:TPA: hypothetical protein DD712_01855 [Candidatus Acetothermia bacterium]|nr:hypothetical protein [Candidatus Acetothermia bacterium]
MLFTSFLTQNLKLNTQNLLYLRSSASKWKFLYYSINSFLPEIKKSIISAGFSGFSVDNKKSRNKRRIVVDSDVSAKSKLLLPDLGDVKQIKIIEWLKKPGELVAAGEAVVEVETEKATFVIEAEKEGQLTRILVHAGATVKSGDVLAEIMLAAL